MASEWIGPTISAAAGLLGTMVGAAVSYYAQKHALADKRQMDAAALAGALRAEISAYLTLMRVRDHVSSARSLAAALRSGQAAQIRGFLDEDSKPLDEFPFFRSQIGSLGVLGPQLCEDVATYYSLISGVQTTVISAQRGKYDALSGSAKADLVEHEAKLWGDALQFGEALLPKLELIARP